MTPTDHRNGFTLVRLLAATAVLVTHSYVVLGIGHGDVLERNGCAGLSKMGVDAFFAMSGYLVTLSLGRDPSLITFAWNRLLRIIPGLAAAVILTAFVVGPIVTSVSDYFARDEVYAYLRNILLFDMHPMLPGVFAGQATPVVNGSLWTLPLEMLCYAGLALLAWAGALRPRALLFVCALLLTLHLTDTFSREASFLTVGRLFLNEQAYLFAHGALLASIATRLPLRWAYTALAAAAIVIGYVVAGDDWHRRVLGYMLLWPYVVVSSALLLKRAAWLNRHDVSYGVYVYGFVVQQCLVHYFPAWRNLYWFTAASVVLAYAAGYASWAFIERPALRFKRRLGGLVHERISVRSAGAVRRDAGMPVADQPAVPIT